jgi:hypothetical protein
MMIASGLLVLQVAAQWKIRLLGQNCFICEREYCTTVSAANTDPRV